MSQMFNSEFQKSMDTLHFSSEAKEQLRARLVQQLSENKKREVKTMHKTYRKSIRKIFFLISIMAVSFFCPIKEFSAEVAY